MPHLSQRVGADLSREEQRRRQEAARFWAVVGRSRDAQCSREEACRRMLSMACWCRETPRAASNVRMWRKGRFCFTRNHRCRCSSVDRVSPRVHVHGWRPGDGCTSEEPPPTFSTTTTAHKSNRAHQRTYPLDLKSMSASSVQGGSVKGLGAKNTSMSRSFDAAPLSFLLRRFRLLLSFFIIIISATSPTKRLRVAVHASGPGHGCSRILVAADLLLIGLRPPDREPLHPPRPDDAETAPDTILNPLHFIAIPLHLLASNGQWRTGRLGM